MDIGKKHDNCKISNLYASGYKLISNRGETGKISD